ncbi:MAG: SDR family oxidoreductase [Pseudomonadota bacterium]
MIKSILITGGGSGIGAALAQALAARGCDVLLAGRRPAPLMALADHSSHITAHPSDVTVAQDQDALVAALATLPAPRGIFHGAGYFQLGKLDALSAADWTRSFETNVTARWALSTKAAPHLRGGRVLFIGSDSARNIRLGGAAYSIAQAASETLRRALQAEWAGRNIAVSAFKPGLVDTDMVQGFLQVHQDEFPAKKDFESYFDRGEFVTPQTVAQFASWVLLDVSMERFVQTEWDIRDPAHHPAWSGSGAKPDTV